MNDNVINVFYMLLKSILCLILFCWSFWLFPCNNSSTCCWYLYYYHHHQWHIPYEPTQVNRTNYKFLFVYVLLRWHVQDREYQIIKNIIWTWDKRCNNTYFFKCNKTLNVAFVLSVLRIFIVQFIAIYPWNTIKMEKGNLSKGKIELRKICPPIFCTNSDISHYLMHIQFNIKEKNSNLSAVLEISIITGVNHVPSSSFHFCPIVLLPQDIMSSLSPWVWDHHSKLSYNLPFHESRHKWPVSLPSKNKILQVQ